MYFICSIFTYFCCNTCLVGVILKNTAYCISRMTYAYYVWGITDVDLQVLTNADGTSNPAAYCGTLMTRAAESSSKQAWHRCLLSHVTRLAYASVEEVDDLDEVLNESILDSIMGKRKAVEALDKKTRKRRRGADEDDDDDTGCGLTHFQNQLQHAMHVQGIHTFFKL